MSEEARMILEEIQKLTERIEQLDTKLTGEIEQLDTKLTGEIEQLDTKLTGEIEQLDTKLTGEIEQLDTRVTGEIRQLNRKVDDIQFTLENETNKNIRIVAEGHLDLTRKLDEAMAVENEKEIFKIRLNCLENELHKVKRRIEESA